MKRAVRRLHDSVESHRRSKPIASAGASRSSPRCAQDLQYAVRTLDPCARLRDRRRADAGDWHSWQHDDLQRRQRPALHAAAGRAPGTDRADLSRLEIAAAKHPLRLYTALRDHNSSFVALAAIRDVTVPISDTAQAARTDQYSGVVRGEVASGNYFDMLGVRAAQGRVITPDDDRTPNAHPVVVISDRLWRTRFNADPQTLGRLTYLNGNPFTIIGILPPSFTGTVFANETDFWAPLMMEAQLGEVGLRPVVVRSWLTSPTGKEDCGPGLQTGDFRVLGRLKPDVTAEAASAQLTAIAASMTQRRPRRLDRLPSSRSSRSCRRGTRTICRRYVESRRLRSARRRSSGSSPAATSPICFWRERP